MAINWFKGLINQQPEMLVPVFEPDSASCPITKHHLITSAWTFFISSCMVSAFVVYSEWRVLFNKAVDAAFDYVDIDKSGTIDRIECEIGVLILFSEINKSI